MVELLVVVAILVVVVGVVVIEREFGKRLDVAEAQELLPDVLHFMCGPSWQEPADQLTWLVRVRLPALVRDALDKRVHGSCTYTPAWGVTPSMPAVLYDEGVSRILRLVSSLYHEVHTMGGFEEPTVVRARIAAEYAAHHP